MAPQRDTDSLEDWVAETHESIVARLEGAKAAQAQTRLTLGTMAVISVMMVIAAYNAYLSYDYYWIVKARCYESGLYGSSDVLRDQAYRDWASSRIVLISLIGIRVSVDDAAVLGTGVLFVLSLWLLLVTRREKHTIGFLLSGTDTPGHDDESPPSPPPEARPQVYASGERWLIFHTIISNSLFVIFDRFSTARPLAGQSPLKPADNEKEGWLNRRGLGIIRGFFFAFPVMASLFVFALDRWSYFRDDPFAPRCESEGASAFFWVSLVFFVLCCVPLIICCWKSSQFSRETESVLRNYGAKLDADLKRERGTAKPA